MTGSHVGHPLLSFDGIVTRWCSDDECNAAGIAENPFVEDEAMTA